MRRRRYTNIEQVKNRRKATFFILLAGAIVVFLFFYGLPLIARFSTFIADLRKDSQPVDITDTTPPAPPRISSLPEVTKETVVEIDGSTEEGATVILYLNSKEEELVADRDGDFTFDFRLNDGKNSISAMAIDRAGNESQESKTIIVTYDNEPPELLIESPTDGESFFGAPQRQLTIKGTTDEGASVTINDRVVVVNSDGTFTFATTLSDGENTFSIKSVDRAENETETSISVTYSS